MSREYTQERYLAAKRTVDDRALNRHVLDGISTALGSASRIVEIGAGIGTMLQRLVEWDRLGDRVTYTLVDTDGDALAAASDRLPTWAESRGYAVTESPDGSSCESPEDSSAGAAASQPAVGTAFELRSADRRVRVETVVADARAYLAGETPDLVVGCAFLDLLRPPAVDALLRTIPNGCVCYFPITFDGGTWFGPALNGDDGFGDAKFDDDGFGNAGFDDLVVDRYHEDMRRRRAPGDPHAGRRLLSRASADYDLLAAGSSDWVVAPVDDGDGDGDGYPADEAYFLHHLIDTVSGALGDDPAVDDERLAAWTERRHAAIETGTLVYVAHQLDVALRV